MEELVFVSEERCMEIQTRLKEQIEFNANIDIEKIKYIAGIDLAYWKENDKEKAVCCITVIDFKTKEIVEETHYTGDITFPYIAGFLAFRELPLIIEVIKKLDISPNIFMFDGNGYLHPRNMGIASHASFYLKKPCIGVAKSYYKVNGIEYLPPVDEAGEYSEIRNDETVYGAALRTHKGVKPVFVSVGNYIDLKTALKITMDMTGKESHIPIPTRYADLATHRMREYYLKNK